MRIGFFPIRRGRRPSSWWGPARMVRDGVIAAHWVGVHRRWLVRISGQFNVEVDGVGK